MTSTIFGPRRLAFAVCALILCVYVSFLGVSSGLPLFVLGLIDNIIVLLCIYIGCDVGKGRLGAACGGLIGNALSDGVGVRIDPTTGVNPWDGVPGVVLGCLVVLLLIPAFELAADWRDSRRDLSL